MSAILDKLLKGQKVEWKTLGEICKKIYSGGTPNTSKPEYWENGTIPWMSSGEVNLGIIYQTEKFITELGLKNSSAKFVPKNSIVIALAGQGKTRGKVARIKIDLTTNQSLASLTFDEKLVNSDYVYHFLESQYENLRQISSGNGNRGGLNLQMISSYQIPIPPLDVQAEIVRILDAFTAVTAELTAELNMREKQYQYYRDKLLSFSSDEINWKKLGDIGEVRMCKRILKNQTAPSGDIPFYKIGTFGKQADAYISKSLFDEYKQKYSYPKIGEILISASGTIGRTVIFDGKDAYFQDSNIVWIENDENLILNKFLFYYYQIVNWGASEGGTISRLYNDNIRKINIPIPPISEQKRIVEILDKFETLTHSITEGLPKEIALRQQQYEYYREQLLDFPRN